MDPRWSLFRKRAAHRVRQHWRRVGASAHRVRRIPQGAFTLFYTPVLAEIADALGRGGKASEGLSIIDEALARSDSNEECWCVAELLHINGELILLEGTPQAATAAEENFLQSLKWARRQGALRWRRSVSGVRERRLRANRRWKSSSSSTMARSSTATSERPIASNFTVIGPDVNLVSRIEAIAKSLDLPLM